MTMNEEIKAAETRIKEIDDCIVELQRERYALSKQIAEARCPFKAGDLVCWGDRKGKVLEVRPKYLGYNLSVQNIRKDGSLGATVFISDYHHPKPYTAPA